MPAPKTRIWIASVISLWVGAGPACISIPEVARGGDAATDSPDMAPDVDASGADAANEAGFDASGDMAFAEAPALPDVMGDLGAEASPGGDTGMGMGDSPAPE